MENSATFKIIIAIAGVLISGSYPLFGMYLRMQEKKFTKLFAKTDKLEEVLPEMQTDIKWLKKELCRLRDKQGE